MGRQPKKCPKKCNRHLFTLKPVHYSAFFSRESQFSYCPQNLKTQPIFPKFNRDGKPYTAAFILATDQIKLIDNDKIYQIEHERFKKLNHEEKTQILVPKPKSKSSYCSNCKQIYDDYQEHILSAKHAQTIKDCEFNDDILKLCQKFGNHVRVSAKIISCDELKTSFHSMQTTNTCQNQKEKPSACQFQQPQLFLQKSTKENLDGLGLYKSMKSFHTYGQNYEQKIDNCNDLHFLQYTMNRQINENYFLPRGGSFKIVEQTASPIKTKFDRPIILAGKSFTLDD